MAGCNTPFLPPAQCAVTTRLIFLLFHCLAWSITSSHCRRPCWPSGSTSYRLTRMTELLSSTLQQPAAAPPHEKGQAVGVGPLAKLTGVSRSSSSSSSPMCLVMLLLLLPMLHDTWCTQTFLRCMFMQMLPENTQTSFVGSQAEHCPVVYCHAGHSRAVLTALQWGNTQGPTKLCRSCFRHLSRG